MINLNSIRKLYKNLKNKYLTWLGVNLVNLDNINTTEYLIDMSKTEKDILTDIIIDNHEEEFRIIEAGDDAGSHFAVYVPAGANSKSIRKEITNKKIKKTVIIIETPPGYIGCIMR